MSGGRTDLNNVINRSNSSNKDDRDLNKQKYFNDKNGNTDCNKRDDDLARFSNEI